MKSSKSVNLDAKEIALHFIKRTDGRATPSIIARSILTAKEVLLSGYSKEEVISVIDYVLDIKKVPMYSLGYVSVCINSILKEINKESTRQRANQIRKDHETSFAEVKQKEVVYNDESKKRNQDRSSRLGLQPNSKRFDELFNKE